MMWLTDGQTDGRSPYHNTSEVLLRAYKNGTMTQCILITPQVKGWPLLLKQSVKKETNKQEEDDLDENMLVFEIF